MKFYIVKKQLDTMHFGITRELLKISVIKELDEDISVKNSINSLNVSLKKYNLKYESYYDAYIDLKDYKRKIRKVARLLNKAYKLTNNIKFMALYYVFVID